VQSLEYDVILIEIFIFGIVVILIRIFNRIFTAFFTGVFVRIFVALSLQRLNTVKYANTIIQ